ncbi:2-dehydropantoate 2-reductase [Corynebacterium suranareeae]|uniref:2-dehydropantoate 2-reductase n=1 Tax=Corynebacterium suranareeae TaxID=2506452 RepID=A0A160PSS2_9CORY|nr:2-dehydropantoate 2-reductase [Corynebacterium suranareeae]BAU95470.1 2-dehydropantoate 2-reductase [Corynebacterium suranareeae]
MKIAIIGAGAVGGYFAALLQESGADVTLVARGQTLEVLQSSGLRVKDAKSDRYVQVPAVASVQELPEVDVVMIATKALATSTNTEELLRGLPENAVVAITQNSVESADIAAEVVGTDRVWPGVVRGFFVHDGPAQVSYLGGPLSYTFGDSGELSQQFADILNEAGIDGIFHPDILVDVWEKAMFVEVFGGLGAFVEKQLGTLRTHFRASLEALMEEVAEVATGLGIALPSDAVERTMNFADRMPEDSTSSMQRDIADGVPSELDAQTGAIVRAARKVGVKTPLHDLIYAALSLKEEENGL